MIKVQMGAYGDADFSIEQLMVDPLPSDEKTATWTATTATIFSNVANSVDFVGEFTPGDGATPRKFWKSIIEVTGFTVTVDSDEQYSVSGLSLTQDELASFETYYSYIQEQKFDIDGNASNNTISAGLLDDELNGLGGNDELFGYDGDDELDGGTGNDTLIGGLGADEMTGGSGNDTYHVDDKGDKIIERSVSGSGLDTVHASVDIDLTAQANVEIVWLDGKGDLDATGSEGAQTLNGNSGDNRLDGGAGNDTLKGGKGDDTYVVDAEGDKVEETATGGTDSVASGVIDLDLADYANVENIELTGKSDLDAIGGKGVNLIVGNSGANRLDGGAGNDTLRGGKGNDTYVVDAKGDKVSETSSGGIDTVETAKLDIKLTAYANIENIELTGKADLDASGDDGVNLIIGNAGKNHLDGGKGADRMVGGAGDDTYAIDHAKDEVVEQKKAGTDTVTSSTIHVDLSKLGNVEDIFLFGKKDLDGTGNGADNVITGNSGDNDLWGETGDDTLEGGDGADTFHFAKGDDADSILDFDASGKGQDHIDLEGFGAKFKFKNIDIEQSGKKNVLLDFGNGDEILLVDVKLKDIDASDFIF